MEGANLSQKLGDLSPKLGKVAHDFDSRFGEIEATEHKSPADDECLPFWSRFTFVV